MNKISIPLSVPRSKAEEFRKNYLALTNKHDRLFLIAGDQKVEHLNADFFGPGIDPEDAEPEHLFKIAQAAPGSALAVPLGLISQYGRDYPEVNYIVKINGKTNLGDNEAKDSHRLFWTVEDVIKLKKQSGLKIAAIGYTVYLGGKYESQMLSEVAQAIWSAHQNGLLAVIWMYPRGKGVKEEDVHTIAGGAGVASSLDADFVKIKYPTDAKNADKAATSFQEAVKAAGRTKVVCVGGNRRPVKDIISELSKQIKISGTSGIAMGRNLHQRSLKDATRLAAAISAVLWNNASAAAAIKIYNSKEKTITKKSKKSSRFLGIF